jgi:hypothetical protein
VDGQIQVLRSLTKAAVGLLMQVNSYEMISVLGVFADEMCALRANVANRSSPLLK